jgi:hypothetical protein
MPFCFLSAARNGCRNQLMLPLLVNPFMGLMTANVSCCYCRLPVFAKAASDHLPLWVAQALARLFPCFIALGVVSCACLSTLAAQQGTTDGRKVLTPEHDLCHTYPIPFDGLLLLYQSRQRPPPPSSPMYISVY